MKQEIRTDQAPTPAGPYSQGLKAGNRVYVAGQRPVIPETGELAQGLEAQSRQCLENVRNVLRAAGAEMDHVVKVTVYLADLQNFAAFNAIYKEYFKPPYPVRTTVSCTLRGVQVEVDAIAELPE